MERLKKHNCDRKVEDDSSAFAHINELILR
jgi:hypothetical protein